MTFTRSVLVLLPMLLSTLVSGQSLSSSELLLELHKLNTVGSALFVAAHPDDENTALLAYLAQEEQLDTAYLSLTRGGGGQNLIGPELKEGLGLIRANELLQARKIDKATQLFTRARDFGYSKNPEDTLENWREEKVLGDVVYAVRYFKPDVIITRFNPTAGPTHGHHTVSAQLALKAFRLAADPKQFPEQLKDVAIHQAKRIFWNGYGRRGGGNVRDEEREVVALEIGRFNPFLGTSYMEIAARSRSMHKSQGFGRAGSRGEQTEQLVLLDGEPANGNFLSGVDTSWSRFPGGSKVDSLLKRVIQDFDPAAPWKSVPRLLAVDSAFDALPDNRQTRAKRKTLHRLIAAAMGMHFEARSQTSYLTPGDRVNLEVEFTNRSPVSAHVTHMEAALFDRDRWPVNRVVKGVDKETISLEQNIPAIMELAFELPESAPLTQPFWLAMEPDTGIYHFENRRLLELESIPPSIEVASEIQVEGQAIYLSTPAIEVVSDPVHGEVHHSVAVRPQVILRPNTSVLLFETFDSKTIDLEISSNSGAFRGTVMAEVPSGWKVGIKAPEVHLTPGNPSVVSLSITPPDNPSEGYIHFKVIRSDGKIFDQSANLIEYDHIGRQPMLTPAKTKLTRLDLKRAGNRIACIEGVGDTVPETLERIGYSVARLSVGDLNRQDLQQFDTVILGPRAFDAVEGLDDRFKELNAYVERGGTLVSQYNTTSTRTKSRFTAPYPLRISRDRVSEENAEVRLLLPNHPVFNTPNKITEHDFENWIQERGLYYADSWDGKYEALLSANDREEPPRDGGLLVAPVGKGWYAYTGLSFFRQLPEGNPGAVRLFINLISLGHGN